MNRRQCAPTTITAHVPYGVESRGLQRFWHLAGVSYLGSCGLSALAVASNQLRESGHRLRTVNESDLVRRILEIAGLDKIFHDED